MPSRKKPWRHANAQLNSIRRAIRRVVGQIDAYTAEHGDKCRCDFGRNRRNRRSGQRLPTVESEYNPAAGIAHDLPSVRWVLEMCESTIGASTAGD